MLGVFEESPYQLGDLRPGKAADHSLRASPKELRQRVADRQGHYKSDEKEEQNSGDKRKGRRSGRNSLCFFACS
jgi:hypothetical protein